MKILTVSALSLLLVGMTFAQKKPSEPIKVCIFTAANEGGFVDADQKQRSDSVKDVEKGLSRDKSVQIVSQKETADVELEVLGRGSAATGTTAVTTPGRYGAQTSSYANTMYVVRIGLKAGDYVSIIEGVDPSDFKSWGGAAGNAIVQIDKWIKDNHDKLVSRRSQ